MDVQTDLIDLGLKRKGFYLVGHRSVVLSLQTCLNFTREEDLGKF